jgi:hypothetical protein
MIIIFALNSIGEQIKMEENQKVIELKGLNNNQLLE